LWLLLRPLWLPYLMMAMIRSPVYPFDLRVTRKSKSDAEKVKRSAKREWSGPFKFVKEQGRQGFACRKLCWTDSMLYSRGTSVVIYEAKFALLLFSSMKLLRIGLLKGERGSQKWRGFCLRRSRASRSWRARCKRVQEGYAETMRLHLHYWMRMHMMQIFAWLKHVNMHIPVAMKVSSIPWTDYLHKYCMMPHTAES
jgi:hypothetical protein